MQSWIWEFRSPSLFLSYRSTQTCEWQFLWWWWWWWWYGVYSNGEGNTCTVEKHSQPLTEWTISYVLGLWSHHYLWPCTEVKHSSTSYLRWPNPTLLIQGPTPLTDEIRNLEFRFRVTYFCYIAAKSCISSCKMCMKGRYPAKTTA